MLTRERLAGKLTGKQMFMASIESFLSDHISLLLTRDDNFWKYWSQLTAEDQSSFLRIAKDIDNCGDGEETIVAQHVRTSRLLTRFMIRVQDIPFDYSRLPDDWLDFVRDQEGKEKLLAQAASLLRGFLTSEHLQSNILMYGNIKPEESLIKRMVKPKGGDQFRRRLLDTWDIVRFRIVTPNLLLTRHVALRILEEQFDKIVRCRNYYFRPKDDDHSDPYRGIHFELETAPGRIVELQVLTRAREVVSFLDHAPSFKKSLQLPSAKHEAWLFFFARKANLFDLDLIEVREDGSTPTKSSASPDRKLGDE